MAEMREGIEVSGEEKTKQRVCSPEREEQSRGKEGSCNTCERRKWKDEEKKGVGGGGKRGLVKEQQEGAKRREKIQQNEVWI